MQQQRYSHKESQPIEHGEIWIWGIPISSSPHRAVLACLRHLYVATSTPYAATSTYMSPPICTPMCHHLHVFGDVFYTSPSLHQPDVPVLDKEPSEV